MPTPPTAVETLSEARAARAAGDVDACLRLSVLAEAKARDEYSPDLAFLAACVPGRLYASRGEPDVAIGFYRNALDIALSHGQTARLPQVYHDLYVVHREIHDNAASRRFYATSLELYLDTGARNPRLTALMADAALGAFMRNPSAETAADALQAFRAVPASLNGATERFLSGCYMLATAAWLGIECRYREGAERLELAYSAMESTEGASLALSFAATAATNARDYPRAAHMAERALSIAVTRGESIAEEQARFVLEAALAERPVRM